VDDYWSYLVMDWNSFQKYINVIDLMSSEHYKTLRNWSDSAVLVSEWFLPIHAFTFRDRRVISCLGRGLKTGPMMERRKLGNT